MPRIALTLKLPLAMLPSCAALCALALSTTAHSAPALAENPGHDFAVREHATPSIPGLGTPISRSRLDGHRGGFDAATSDMQLSGSVAGNSAVNVVTGGNYVSDGAFTNASGFPTVIQNSGSNVLIQNATIVNLQMQ